MVKDNDCSGRDSAKTDTTTKKTSMVATMTNDNGVGATWRRAQKNSRRDVVKVHQLTDLTDKPINMKNDQISRSQVRATGSNCICCCHNNSISLVTTNDSYTLEHVPLDNIQTAEANSGLQYLAMSNEHKIAIIDLVENPHLPTDCSRSTSICCTTSSSSSSSNGVGGTSKLGRRACAKVVNLAGKGLTMDDVLHWRWIDEFCLALVTQEALYICPVDQTQINHPALTALARPSQLLSIEKVCDINNNLAGEFCRITDIQRDASANLYAISGLCRPSDYYQANYSLDTNRNSTSSQLSTATNYYYRLPSFKSSTLKHSFSSVPGRLSQLVHNERSFDSIKSEAYCESLRKITDQTQCRSTAPPELGDDRADELCGLAQIYCKLRDRSQLIQVHAVTFASCPMSLESSLASADSGVSAPNVMSSERLSTTLVAANRTEDKLRVHFIGMASTEDLATNGQSASPSTKFHCPDKNKYDFPTSIVCSTINGDARLHVAMIATKYGQLYVCSVVYGTILFDVRVSYDVISSTVLESRTGGLMGVCRNGHVLLVELDGDKLSELLDKSRCLRPVPSFDFLSSRYFAVDSNENFTQPLHDNSFEAQQDSFDSETLISTRL